MDGQIIERRIEPISYDLLFLADPNRKMIDQYLAESKLFLYQQEDHTIGVIVIKIVGAEAEIMNVAVDERYQGIGIGSKLIRFAIQKAKALGLHKLSIGTADTSSDQLRLYQKLGFSITERIKNFFIEHYPKPIYENGKQAKDMIRLEMSLS